MRLVAAAVALALASCDGPHNDSWPDPYGSHLGTPVAGNLTPVPTPMTVVPTSSLRECPEKIPDDRSPCGAPIHCEYGANADPHCNALAICDTFGSWSVTPPYQACADQCEDDFSSITAGGSCGKVGTVCTYYEGTCGCLGTAADGGSAGKWTCVQPASGCPARRPVVNAPCVVPMTCDYGSCTFGVSLAFICDGTRWSRAQAPDGGCLDRDR